MSVRIGIAPHLVEHAEQPYVFLYETYWRYVRGAGYTPVIVPPDDADAALDLCDAVLLSGGGPGLDAHRRHWPLARQHPRRYAFDAALIRRCAERNIPLFGICRGFQTIGECLGGEMNLRVESSIEHLQTEPGSVPTHKITIAPETILATALGESAQVNSFHVQSLKSLPKGWIVAARAEDGVIEAFESPDQRIMGVAFHPEKLAESHPQFFKILQVFVQHNAR